MVSYEIQSFLNMQKVISEGISKFLLLKTTSTQEAKMKMSLNAFKTNVYFYWIVQYSAITHCMFTSRQMLKNRSGNIISKRDANSQERHRIVIFILSFIYLGTACKNFLKFTPFPLLNIKSAKKKKKNALWIRRNSTQWMLNLNKMYISVIYIGQWMRGNQITYTK